MYKRDRDRYRDRGSEALILMTLFTQLWDLASLKFVELAEKLEIQGRADDTVLSPKSTGQASRPESQGSISMLQSFFSPSFMEV